MLDVKVDISYHLDTSSCQLLPPTVWHRQNRHIDCEKRYAKEERVKVRPMIKGTHNYR